MYYYYHSKITIFVILLPDEHTYYHSDNFKINLLSKYSRLSALFISKYA